MPEASTRSVRITIDADRDVSPEVIDKECIQLLRELKAAEIHDVTRPSGPAPSAGTRGAEISDIGTLLIAIAPAVPVISRLISVLELWIKKHPARKIHMVIGDSVIDMSNVPRGDATRLIEGFLRSQDDNRSEPG